MSTTTVSRTESIVNYIKEDESEVDAIVAEVCDEIGIVHE